MERPLRMYSGFMRGDAKASLTKEAMQLMVDGQRHLRGIEGRMLVDRLIRTDNGCILWLCLDEEAEEGMARIDGTISLGFAGCVKFQERGEDPVRSWRNRGSGSSKSNASCRSSRRLSSKSWRTSTARLILESFPSSWRVLAIARLRPPPP